MTAHERREWLKCSESCLYFIFTYCQIYDATRGDWIPFHLWPAQANTLRTILNNRLIVILKARQLGATWLALAFALWLALFRPAATILIFSRRDDEAIYLLSQERTRGMYARLPSFLKCRAVLSGNDHEWALSNGSVLRAFPTTAGDSYTASLVIIDEADLAPDFDRLIGAAKPTIDSGGKMIVLSRSDKSKPQSAFKQLYRTAKAKANAWVSIFLPWHTRPERDLAWYEEQKRDCLSRTGALDYLHEHYPATDTEALAAATLDKRIAPDWLEQCYVEQGGLSVEKAPAIPGLIIYQEAKPGFKYVLGADPAEGNPTSNDSALTVGDKESGEEVARLAGKFQPSTFAAHINAIGIYFNNAAALIERNNHGHAVLLWLRDHSSIIRLDGWDGKEGWLSNTKGNALLYDACADAFRDGKAGGTIIHSFDTHMQLASIEGSSLSAPQGEQDDLADSYALMIQAKRSVDTKSYAVKYA